MIAFSTRYAAVAAAAPCEPAPCSHLVEVEQVRLATAVDGVHGVVHRALDHGHATHLPVRRRPEQDGLRLRDRSSTGTRSWRPPASSLRGSTPWPARTQPRRARPARPSPRGRERQSACFVSWSSHYPLRDWTLCAHVVFRLRHKVACRAFMHDSSRLDPLLRRSGARERAARLVQRRYGRVRKPSCVHTTGSEACMATPPLPDDPGVLARPAHDLPGADGDARPRRRLPSTDSTHSFRSRIVRVPRFPVSVVTAPS